MPADHHYIIIMKLICTNVVFVNDVVKWYPDQGFSFFVRHCNFIKACRRISDIVLLISIMRLDVRYLAELIARFYWCKYAILISYYY